MSLRVSDTVMADRIKYAFIKSLPVMCGYIFLGIAYGIVLQDAGFGPAWALAISTFVYAGSAQFVMVPLMAAGTSIITMAVTILFVNSRHLFYGLSFTESFAKLKSRPYMIFSLTDETYSVLCGCRNEDLDERMREAWPLIALFDQTYWVLGSFLGALLGKIIPFDMTGIDFSMTALFTVILLDQIRVGGKKAASSAALSMIVAIVCLLLFGGSNFLLPTLIITVFIVGFIGRNGEENGHRADADRGASEMENDEKSSLDGAGALEDHKGGVL